MSNKLNEAINNPPSKYYKRVEEKPYHKWLNEHKDEVLKQPLKTRTQYTFEKINADLNLNLKYEAVYQLLYRIKLLVKDENEPPVQVKPNPHYYLNQLIEHLTEVNSAKRTKKCIDKLMELYAKQAKPTTVSSSTATKQTNKK